MSKLSNQEIQARIGVEGEYKPKLTLSGAIVQEVAASSYSLGNGRYAVKNFGEIEDTGVLEQLRTFVAGGVRTVVKRGAKDANDE